MMGRLNDRQVNSWDESILFTADRYTLPPFKKGLICEWVTPFWTPLQDRPILHDFAICSFSLREKHA